MKRTLLLVFSLFFVLDLAFSQAKRYIFLEHFTNTRCGICAGANPGFYSLLTGYKNQYHHISFHPAIPYTSCALYQSNPVDNTQRTNFYNISGTPTLVINGLTKKSLGSVNAATLNAELNKTSAIEIIVKESGTNPRSAAIEIKTVGTKPVGNYKFYAVALEKELNYASPNGEKIHYDVFRDFLSSADGDQIDLAATGSSVTKNFSISIPSNWVESQVYIMAWIQDADTKEVLNSGTPFDIVTSATNLNGLQFTVYPNPVKDMLKLEWQNAIPVTGKILITNLMGREIYSTYLKSGSKQFQYPVAAFPKGIYFVQIQSGNEKASRKWVKD